MTFQPINALQNSWVVIFQPARKSVGHMQCDFLTLIQLLIVCINLLLTLFTRLLWAKYLSIHLFNQCFSKTMYCTAYTCVIHSVPFHSLQGFGNLLLLYEELHSSFINLPGVSSKEECSMASEWIVRKEQNEIVRYVPFCSGFNNHVIEQVIFCQFCKEEKLDNKGLACKVGQMNPIPACKVNSTDSYGGWVRAIFSLNSFWLFHGPGRTVPTTYMYFRGS